MKDFSEQIQITALNSSFRKLVGEFNNHTQQEEINLENVIYRKYFKGKQDDIQKAFETIVQHNEEYPPRYVTIDDIGGVMASCGCKVAKEHLEYLHLVLFKENDSVERLEWKKLGELFGTNFENQKVKYDEDYLNNFEQIQKGGEEKSP